MEMKDMVKVEMEFELEDLKNVKVLIEENNECREVYFKDFRKGLVKIINAEGEDDVRWMRVEDVKVVDIFFQ
jgi:hypothetical protein